MLRAFLAWIHFDVNPLGWTYLLVMVPSLMVCIVRYIHYYPLIVATHDDAKEGDLISTGIMCLIWPLSLALLIVYEIACGFVWLVRRLWPITLPEPSTQQTDDPVSVRPVPQKATCEPMSHDELNDLLEED